MPTELITRAADLERDLIAARDAEAQKKPGLQDPANANALRLAADHVAYAVGYLRKLRPPRLPPA